MKFAAIIAITLALVMGVHSSLYPLVHNHLAVASPLHIVSSPLVHLAHSAPGSVAVHASAWAPHAALALNAPHLGVHALAAHGLEGQYIAKTRGAVHSAPLAGHAASAASINLAPAPGTL